MIRVQQQPLYFKMLLFPIALVMFEFAVLICNDLIQPAMIAITADFGVNASLAPSAMSFFLLGGASIAWLLGPLSDRKGRKPVMLFGVILFVLSSLLITLSQNMTQFLALRFIQGFGLSFVATVGYAAIQEHFDENTSVKVLALMANISMLAPLLGPILGAFLIDHVAWQWGFIAIAVLASLSWVGLKCFMPNLPATRTNQPYSSIFNDYKTVYTDKQFWGLVLALPLTNIPLMLWISLSPVILVKELGLSSLQYGLAQIPVLGSLIVGNIVMMLIVDRFKLGQTVYVGLPLMLLGATCILFGIIFDRYFLYGLIIGMTMITFGQGISYSVLYRFALMSSHISKGTLAAAVSMLLSISVFVGIEVIRVLYDYFHFWTFGLSCFVLIALWFSYPRQAFNAFMLKRENMAESA